MKLPNIKGKYLRKNQHFVSTKTTKAKCAYNKICLHHVQIVGDCHEQKKHMKRMVTREAKWKRERRNKLYTRPDKNNSKGSKLKTRSRREVSLCSKRNQYCHKTREDRYPGPERIAS